MDTLQLATMIAERMEGYSVRQSKASAFCMSFIESGNDRPNLMIVRTADNKMLIYHSPHSIVTEREILFRDRPAGERQSILLVPPEFADDIEKIMLLINEVLMESLAEGHRLDLEYLAAQRF